MAWLQAGFYPKIPSHYSSEVNELIRVCLSQDPRKRPTIDELLLLPAVQRRRSALSHVMDSTLKAAIALEEDVELLATIAVCVCLSGSVCMVLVLMWRCCHGLHAGAKEHQAVDESAARALLS